MITLNRRSKRPVKDIVKYEYGRVWIYIQGGDVKVPLPDDRIYNGSRIGPKAVRATCLKCGRKHAVGLRCAICDGERIRDHRNQKKPDDIKGT